MYILCHVLAVSGVSYVQTLGNKTVIAVIQTAQVIVARAKLENCARILILESK